MFFIEKYEKNGHNYSIFVRDKPEGCRQVFKASIIRKNHSFVGGIKEYNDLDILVEAFEKISSNSDVCLLLIAGPAREGE